VTAVADGRLQALYFDGRSARGQPVWLSVQDGQLRAEAVLAADANGVSATPATERRPGLAPKPAPDLAPDLPPDPRPDPMRWPLADVQWPETTRHGQRVLHLRQGGSVQAQDAAAFDTWRQALLSPGGAMGAVGPRHGGARESWVVRAQQNWRAAAAAALLLLVLVGVGWRWGVPVVATGVLAVLPQAADKAVGDAAWQSIEERWLEPSFLPAARQAQLRDAFARSVAAAYPPGPGLPAAPVWQLRFAAADKNIGPNAFALPGGTIVLTDALVELLKDQDDALIGVLAHELGHVRHRHGMRAFVQFSLVSAVASLVLGDFSSVLAAVPAFIAQMAYSRDAEREADIESVRVMRASGRPPGALALLFERLQAEFPKRPALPMALSSHPADAERLKFFRDAERGR
jgi:Zn-dependent protease with chaperone function